MAGAQLPQNLRIPFSVMTGMEDSWNRMIEDPEHKERGACIILEPQVTLRLDDEVTGTSAHMVAT
jgi:hypothetical protein